MNIKFLNYAKGHRGRFFTCITTVGASLLGLNALPAYADIVTNAIEIDHPVSFTKPDFSDAQWSSTLTFTLPSGSSGTRDFPLLFWPGNFGLSFFSTGSVSIDRVSDPAMTSSDTVHVTAAGGGTFGFHETAGQEQDFATGDPLIVYTSTNTGRRNLAFAAPSSGDTTHLDAGALWTTKITMPGNWSQSSDGDVFGTHYLSYVDPAWTVINNFDYDPVTNTTLLSVFNPKYPGATSADNAPYPEFFLLGPVVPEPSSFLLLGLGGTIVAVLCMAQRHCR